MSKICFVPTNLGKKRIHWVGAPRLCVRSHLDLIMAVAGKYLATRWQQRQGSLMRNRIEPHNYANQCNMKECWIFVCLLLCNIHI